MPRKARDERLDTRAARLRLQPRREPYFRNIQEGRAIGYRRAAGGKAGNWIARYYDSAGERVRKYLSLGVADDFLDADGHTTLTFTQAQEAARGWFSEVTRDSGRVVKPLTVSEAMLAYIADYTARGGKDLSGLQSTIQAHINPALGSRNIDDLTNAIIRSWFHSVASAARRVRMSSKPETKPKPKSSLQATEKPGDKLDAQLDADRMRARRSSANRILTILKAGLNLAFNNGQARSDESWRRIKPFKGVEAARIRFLTDDEAIRLINGSSEDFRHLAKAALLTGARYSEIYQFKVADFDPRTGTIYVPRRKTKERHVTLNAEGLKFFEEHCLNKAKNDLILQRSSGKSWSEDDQIRPMKASCKAAEIIPAVGFHILRHTHASRLTMAGVPLGVVAAQIGDSEATTAKHYAHLSPAFIADSIRAAFGSVGITSASNAPALSAA